MHFSREHRILLATAILAAGVPAGAYMFVHARTADLAKNLGAASGTTASIGAVDADLTGSVRLTDVALGSLFEADGVEASVALDSLLSGELRADEIQVAGPRVALDIGADGDSDFARLVRRFASRRSGLASRPRAGGPRLRRIVVSEGTLTARIAGLGEISADGVELVPDEGGVRVITGALRMTTHRSASVDGDSTLSVHRPALLSDVDVGFAFARSAAELSLPQFSLRRALAVGGTGAITAGGRAISLTDVVAGRLSPDAPLDLHAAVDDNGIPRPIALSYTASTHTLVADGDHVPLAGLASIAPKSVLLDAARASGHATLRADGGSLALDLDGTIDDVAIDHPTLAAQPIPFSAAIKTTIAIAADAVTLPKLDIDTGALHVHANGWFRKGSAVRDAGLPIPSADGSIAFDPTSPATAGKLELSIDQAPCNDLLASLPAELRGPLDGIVLAGDLGLDAKLSLDLAEPLGDGAQLSTAFTGACTALAEPPAADVTTLTASSTHTLPDGARTTIGPGEPGWIEYTHIPEYVRGAFVSAEDGRYWDHDGFDLQQISRSLEIDLREHRLARGGSTISQQLVKNAFLTQRRTLDRKVQEVVLTWRLEARLNKKQILERYLNLIELGPHVHGIGAAAKYWFDRAPERLTIKQAAFLAAITSEPTSMSRRVRQRGGLDQASSDRVQTILRAMRRDHVITNAEYDAHRSDGMDFAPTAIRDDR
ncbi:MAG TPA: transglycosylase domain-containing protein [Kofleriaceae bacterium]